MLPCDNCKRPTGKYFLFAEKKFHQLKLLEEKERHRAEVCEVKISSKNSANQTISELNKQIVTERAKMFAEQQEVKKRLEEEFNMKETRLQQSLSALQDSLAILEKREEAWEEEKAEVVLEVGRLKAEASKMVSLLALEYEEENLSEEKKRSLSAEVYSLQLVVDMRTGEVRNLRDQLATLTHHLEIMQDVQTKLDKANNRIEDLEEQLKLKVQSAQ